MISGRTMLTKAQKRAIISLQDKRDRDRLGLYVVEGDKLVREAAAAGCSIESIYAEGPWISSVPLAVAERAIEVTADELRQLSAQKTPNRALAVVRRPPDDADWHAPAADLVFVLEGIQDPGNLGSLLRVAAWFGVGDVVSSPDCADALAPKVVQGSMGAVFRVRVHTRRVVSFVTEACACGLPIYATALDGESVYEAALEPRGLILLGNESSGLSGELLRLATRCLTIPAWSGRGPGKDSLNVAVAAAVVCSEFRRRIGRAAGAGAMHRSTMADAR
jgi:TrmH family RNA methyltransferase